MLCIGQKSDLCFAFSGRGERAVRHLVDAVFRSSLYSSEILTDCCSI